MSSQWVDDIFKPLVDSNEQLLQDIKVSREQTQKTIARLERIERIDRTLDDLDPFTFDDDATRDTSATSIAFPQTLLAEFLQASLQTHQSSLQYQPTTQSFTSVPTHQSALWDTNWCLQSMQILQTHQAPLTECMQTFTSEGHTSDSRSALWDSQSALWDSQSALWDSNFFAIEALMQPLPPPPVTLSSRPSKRKRSDVLLSSRPLKRSLPRIPYYFTAIQESPLWCGLHIFYDVKEECQKPSRIFYEHASQGRQTKLRVAPAFCKTLVSNHVTIYIAVNDTIQPKRHNLQTVSFPHVFRFKDVCTSGAAKKSIDFCTSIDAALVGSYYNMVVSHVTHIAIAMVLFRRCCRQHECIRQHFTDVEELDIPTIVRHANALTDGAVVPSRTSTHTHVFVRGMKLAHKLFAATAHMVADPITVPDKWEALRAYLLPSERCYY